LFLHIRKKIMKNSARTSRASLVLVLVFTLLSTALLSTALAADRQMQFAVSDQQMQALGIQVAPLQKDASPVVARLPAQLIVPPDREQIVSAPFAGLVTQLFIQPHNQVKKDAPLMRIASPELGQMQLQLIQSLSRAMLARQAAQRESALFKEGIIPERRVFEAQAALKESEATLYQAKATLRMSGFSASDVNKLTTTSMPEQSLVLRAAKAGVVTDISVKLGQRVDANTALLRLTQKGNLWLDIQAPVGDSDNWKPGTEIKIQGRDSTARVKSVGSEVSANNQTVTLRAEMESDNPNLRAGEFVTVEMPAIVVKEGWNVPLSAVMYEDKQAYVFVRNANNFEVRAVTVIASAGQRLHIKGKLKEGESIATSGIIALKGAWLADKGEP
jgi:RND family efflux transporter MFP subunit